MEDGKKLYGWHMALPEYVAQTDGEGAMVMAYSDRWGYSRHCHMDLEQLAHFWHMLTLSAPGR